MKLESNIWKYFVYNLSQRRNFFPIIAIYFLTIPGKNPTQIGFYIAAGSVATLLLEVPSGFLADIWWHKKTLIL